MWIIDSIRMYINWDSNFDFNSQENIQHLLMLVKNSHSIFIKDWISTQQFAVYSEKLKILKSKNIPFPSNDSNFIFNHYKKGKL